MTSQNSRESNFDAAVAALRSASRIVVLSGAGLSSASGIATFRDTTGFWKRFPPEEFANWKGLLQNAVLSPARVAEFLIELLGPIADANPNAGHLAISQLQTDRQVDVVTQNIDSLHQAAGSEHVHEVHGSLYEIVDIPNGNIIRTLDRKDLRSIVHELKEVRSSAWGTPRLMSAIAPLLKVGLSKSYRPNLVLFGDQMAEPAWSTAQVAVDNADLMIVVGTSQVVYPAASLSLQMKERGLPVIVIDPDAEPAPFNFQATAEDFLPRLVTAVAGPKTPGLNGSGDEKPTQ